MLSHRFRLALRLVQSAPFVRDRRDILAQTVRGALKQSAGIDLKVSLVDQGTATKALETDEYEVFDNSRADTAAGAALNLLLCSSGAINRTGAKDPALDRLLDAGQATANAGQRQSTYHAVQQRAVVFARPRHEFARALLAAVPTPAAIS
jgi:peptide/nickel transport system substrate-binding protein